MMYNCGKLLGAGTFGSVYEVTPLGDSHSSVIQPLAVVKKQLFNYIDRRYETNPLTFHEGGKCAGFFTASKPFETHRELSVSIGLGQEMDVNAILAEEEQWRQVEQEQAHAAGQPSTILSADAAGFDTSTMRAADALFVPRTTVDGLFVQSHAVRGPPIIPRVLDAFLAYQPGVSDNGRQYSVRESHEKVMGSLELCTVSERAGADLWTWMCEDPELFLEPGLQAEIARQLISLMADFHGRGLVHRDIKPQNVLLDFNSYGWPLVRLCDMGSVKTIAVKDTGKSLPVSNPLVTSRYYRAPELLCNSSQYGSPVDVWALALTLQELYTLPASLTDPCVASDVAMSRDELDYGDMEARIQNSYEKKYGPNCPKKLLDAKVKNKVAQLTRERAQQVQLFPGIHTDASQLMHIINILGMPNPNDVISMGLPDWSGDALSWMCAEMQSRAAEKRTRDAALARGDHTAPPSRTQSNVAVLPLFAKTTRNRIRQMTQEAWQLALKIMRLEDHHNDEEAHEQIKGIWEHSTGRALCIPLDPNKPVEHQGISKAIRKMVTPENLIGRCDLYSLLHTNLQVPRPLASILSRMLKWNPSERMTCRQALAYPAMMEVCGTPFIPDASFLKKLYRTDLGRTTKLGKSDQLCVSLQPQQPPTPALSDGMDISAVAALQAHGRAQEAASMMAKEEMTDDEDVECQCDEDEEDEYKDRVVTMAGM